MLDALQSRGPNNFPKTIVVLNSKDTDGLKRIVGPMAVNDTLVNEPSEFHWHPIVTGNTSYFPPSKPGSGNST